MIEPAPQISLTFGLTCSRAAKRAGHMGYGRVLDASLGLARMVAIHLAVEGRLSLGFAADHFGHDLPIIFAPQILHHQVQGVEPIRTKQKRHVVRHTVS